MRKSLASCGLLILALVTLAGTLTLPASAAAGVFFYSLTTHGDLVKYDPDADKLEVLIGAGQGYVDQRNEDIPGPESIRILDVARQRIVTGSGREESIALLDLQANTAKLVDLGPPGTVYRIRQFIYPRRASRFYVHWLRQSDPAQPVEVVMTIVGLDGQNLGMGRSPLGEAVWPVYHPDGRNFFAFMGSRRTALIDGETLAVLATYDLTPFAQPGVSGPGLNDVRDGRALLAEGVTTPGDPTRRLRLFTTDLSFSPPSASFHVATGLTDPLAVRLIPGGQTVLVQERRDPGSLSGAGQLHFFDLANGTKLGTVQFSAPQGADILGFHPDGRRLFFRVHEIDPKVLPLTMKTRLVIVDVTTRTILRDRAFEDIGIATDFVDEP